MVRSKTEFLVFAVERKDKIYFLIMRIRDKHENIIKLLSDEEARKNEDINKLFA